MAEEEKEEKKEPVPQVQAKIPLKLVGVMAPEEEE
jgi:hypothetical protein